MDADDAESEMPDEKMSVRTPMREEWIDRLKGILITLVVLGHAVGSAAITADESVRPFFSGVYRVIYLFHMPAFFLLSGMLWKRPTGSFGAFALRKMKRLLVPFWVFGIFSMIIYWLFAGQVAIQDASGYWLGTLRERHWWAPLFFLATGSIFPGTDGFKCNGVLWFLPCLFSMQCCYWMVDRVLSDGCKGFKMLIGVMCVLGLVIKERLRPVWIPLQLDMVLRYAFYFMLGVVGVTYFKRIQIKRYLLLGLVVVWIIVAWNFPFDARNDYYYGLWGCTVMMGATGSVLALCVAKMFKFRGVKIMGMMSLGIMLIHKFPLLFFQTKVPFVAKWLAGSCLVAVITCVGMALVVIMLSYVGTKIILHWCPWALGVGTQTVSKRCL